jgi:O-methyltransferase involved in polyketide biosynthesis
MRNESSGRRGDLSLTALYTSATWTWARLPGADLLASREAKAVFDVTNLALAIPRALRRGPSLACSLVQRHLMIDRLVERGAHVLELAAGLSRRGVAMTVDPSVIYTEIDLPATIARKRELLSRSESGRAAVARSNLRLIGADLLDAALGDFATAPAGTPLVVIAEGLFMYLDAEAQRSLWRRIRALFDVRPGLFVFDLVPAAEQARPGVTGRALGWAFRRATRGARFVRDERSRDDLAEELRTIGFAVELLEPVNAPPDWRLPYRHVRTQTLLFVCRVRS